MAAQFQLLHASVTSAGGACLCFRPFNAILGLCKTEEPLGSQVVISRVSCITGNENQQDAGLPSGASLAGCKGSAVLLQQQQRIPCEVSSGHITPAAPICDWRLLTAYFETW
ncbi:hypothetical protein BKA67DRAFT_531902 [Truncatella angustata]|uniref:Uncharacterized protein n=1 Tax=Truncatella angustata TaxID=152316 RepID=A0A9P8UR25_9PEZI|nr:uncharacterized protein BKA67DRAFT_531902 [Truncatella angustata]KAH6656641.1 hypothetical protein BKA67DRAFT_531902 [Truncatella angustata]